MAVQERVHQPVVFDEFFELGLPDSKSPFLTAASRRWGHLLHLKATFVAAGFLLLAFIFSFFPSLAPLSAISLLFVYFLAGIPSLIESIEILLTLQVNIDVLMTLAAFSSALIGSPMEGGLLLVLFALSGAMEEMVEGKAKSAISHLKQIAPKRASVVQDGQIIEKALPEIPLGAHILIKAGEVVPLDGEVVEGASLVNLIHLTGEAVPLVKQKGDEVPAGARTVDGMLTLKVTHISSDSTLTRIIQLVTEAQESKPRLQRWFDRFSSTYATTIISLSVFFAVTLPFVLGLPVLGEEGSIYRALAFLIAASPCALIIAIPTAYLSAISSCAKNGILLKGGIALDALSRCSAIAFDKTGTLTTGSLTCLGIEPLEETDVEISEALSVARALEWGAVHPVAKAVLDYTSSLKQASVEQYKVIAGFGVEAIFGKVPVYIGSPDYLFTRLEEKRVLSLKDKLKVLRQEGDLVAVLRMGDALFIFRFQDTLREGIKPLLERLKSKFSLRLLMLTGDHEDNARLVSKALGITEYYADLKPEDKLYQVVSISEKESLAMIGDGINDAPALARATVGIAMGKVGSSTALEASDIVLLQDRLDLLEWLMAKAKKTRTIVLENLCLALMAIVFASTPALLGWVPLWLAVVMHEGGTVLVGLNALRLLKR